MENIDILGGFSFHAGPLLITQTLVTSWGLTFALGLLCWLSTRRLKVTPGPWQTALEGSVETMREAVSSVLPEDTERVFPFVASLWLFLIACNLTGLVPGLHSPTEDLSLTSALAVLVFLSVHWFGIRSQGLGAYLRHYLSPSPILLPFHVIGEITRTVALAIRLFGNMMSLELAAVLVLLVAGFLAPIPLLMLHIVEALVQAYLFGMLALIYIAGGIQSQQLTQRKKD